MTQIKGNYVDPYGVEKRRDYALLSANSARALSVDVQLMLEDGWKQWGPPQCTAILDEIGHNLYQAVVRDVEVNH